MKVTMAVLLSLVFMCVCYYLFFHYVEIGVVWKIVLAVLGFPILLFLAPILFYFLPYVVLYKCQNCGRRGVQSVMGRIACYEQMVDGYVIREEHVGYFCSDCAKFSRWKNNPKFAQYSDSDKEIEEKLSMW